MRGAPNAPCGLKVADIVYVVFSLELFLLFKSPIYNAGNAVLITTVPVVFQLNRLHLIFYVNDQNAER